MQSKFAIKSRVASVLIALIVIGGLYVVSVLQPGPQLLNFHFNAYALISLATLVTNAGLVIYMARKPARTEDRIWLNVYLIGLCVYAIGELLQRLSVTPQAAGFWAQISVAGGAIPAALFLFTLAYTNQSERRFPITTAFLLTAPIALAFFYDATNILFSVNPTASQLEPWGYVQTAGQGLIFTVLWYNGLLLVALGRLINFRRHTSNAILRKQSMLFILAMCIPVFIGTFTDAILPILGVNFLPPLAISLFTPAAVMLIYGITHYQLLTINPTLFSGTILSIMRESVIVVDKQLRIHYINDAAQSLLGLHGTPKENQPLVTFIDLETVAFVRKAISEEGQQNLDLAEGGVTQTSHRKVPVHITGSQVKLGDTALWVLVLSDITKELQTRKVIEHEVEVRTYELNEARTYLVSSINSLEQGFLLVNGQGKVELINRRAVTLLMEDSSHGADLLQRPASSVLQHLAADQDVGAAVTKTLENKRGRALAVSNNGSFYQVYITPVLGGNELLGATVIIQDVTEQKILDRSKDEFFSIASHELRTPLTAIRGNMSMAKEYYAEALRDETLKGLVDDTHAASIRLIEIVNDFLDSSSLEQGKMRFDLQPVRIAPLLESVTSDLKPLTSQQNNTLKLDGLDKLPAVEADPARLRQICYNLLSNANKYSEHAQITVTGETDGKNLVLRFIDTGKGISLENQKLLFHKFQQAGDSILTRDNTKGTGLGLYISKLLANNMHGDVVLEHTEVGKGSTFMVTLPLATKEELKEAAKAEKEKEAPAKPAA